MNCLKDTVVTIIDIKPLWYGSLFDEWGTKICLCEDCLKNSPFKEPLEVVDSEDLKVWAKELNAEFKEYKNEKALYEYAEHLPVVGREKFFNSYAYGDIYGKVSPSEWIATEMGEDINEI